MAGWLADNRPLISFFLFNATVSSPPLGILCDPARLDEELKKYAMTYLQTYVKVDRSVTHIQSLV